MTTRKPNAAVSFRPPPVTRQQIDDLIEAWGEDQSAVIVRAIQIAWTIESTEKEGKEGGE